MAAKKKLTQRASKKVSKRGKIWVMGVDPFSGGDFKPMWDMIRPMAEHAGARVIAAYIMAPASFNWTGNFSGPWMKKYLPLSEAKLKEVLPDHAIEKVVVPCQQSGLRAAAEALIRFARRNKADGLVISTHARTGLTRLAMGSFAETLILISKIPTLVLNPNQKVPEHVHRILIPTDLSKKSEKFLESAIGYAKSLGAEIILFHKQPDPLDPLIQQGVYSLGGGWVSVQSFIDDELDEKNKRIAKLERMVRKHKVPVSHVLDSSPDGLIESIDKAARDSGADLVSVLTQSGSWSTAILGSVARGLVRHSSVPVLVSR